LGFACLLLAAAYYSKRWEKNDDLLCVLPVLAERERERGGHRLRKGANS